MPAAEMLARRLRKPALLLSAALSCYPFLRRANVEHGQIPIRHQCYCWVHLSIQGLPIYTSDDTSRWHRASGATVIATKSWIPVLITRVRGNKATASVSHKGLPAGPSGLKQPPGAAGLLRQGSCCQWAPASLGGRVGATA